MKITIILVSLPEIIKMSRVIQKCKMYGFEYCLLRNNWHYSYKMNNYFLEQLWTTKAKYNLDIVSGRYDTETGKILAGIEQIIINGKPNLVFVQSDTNIIFTEILAASKLYIEQNVFQKMLDIYMRKVCFSASASVEYPDVFLMILPVSFNVEFFILFIKHVLFSMKAINRIFPNTH